MIPVQLSHLTDDELIRHLQDTAHHSPVLSELVKRLQKHVSDIDLAVIKDTVQCPVCMASLRGSIDEDNNVFVLTTLT